MSVLDDHFDYILDCDDPYDEFVDHAYSYDRRRERSGHYPRGHFSAPDYTAYEGVSYELMEWRTAEGKILLIRDMDRNHLINSKRVMENNGTTQYIQYQRICEELENRSAANDFK